MLTARTDADLRETAEIAHRDKKSAALTIAGDVGDAKHAQRVVADAAKRFGRVDVLVNNAGYAPLKLIEEITHVEWQRLLDINLSGVFYFCKAVWPIFRKQKSGAIVNISSVASRDPYAGLGMYGATKAAVNLMGLALAREGDADGIRVHTIAPGAVETGMFRAFMSEAQYSRENTLDPAEIARLVGQCATGELAHTSGEVIYAHKRVK